MTIFSIILSLNKKILSNLGKASHIITSFKGMTTDDTDDTKCSTVTEKFGELKTMRYTVYIIILTYNIVIYKTKFFVTSAHDFLGNFIVYLSILKLFYSSF